LALHPVKHKENLKSGQHILIGFSASDFDNTVNKLKEKGVVFLKILRKKDLESMQ
jgi:hypothetical protein